MGDDDAFRDEATQFAEPRSGTSAQLCQLHYRPLVRLAALLIGDAAAAEEIAVDALTTVALREGHNAADVLALLQREVVTRCRRSRHYLRVGQKRRLAGGEFEQLPVVLALRGLRASLREAVVLTLYLDLPESRAAAIAGISEAALRANVSAAMQTLDSQVI
jgi:DNA-directed RNA polymerase specialized sigma24 family protein